jgi:hypothetical protein
MIEQKTIFVKYKNIDGNHEEESKKPYIEIKAERFNPIYQKKLFWRNLMKNLSTHFNANKFDRYNPWIVAYNCHYPTFSQSSDTTILFYLL